MNKSIKCVIIFTNVHLELVSTATLNYANPLFIDNDQGEKTTEV